jgi:hypothetical protein
MLCSYIIEGLRWPYQVLTLTVMIPLFVISQSVSHSITYLVTKELHVTLFSLSLPYLTFTYIPLNFI